MALTGTLNGTDVALAVETTPGGGTYANVGGLTSNSFTANNGAIDLTNKSSGSWREIMDGEGLQSVDISAEIIFCDDANFKIMKDSARDKTTISYQVARGAEVLEGSFYIATWTETATDNDKVTVSVSMQSSGAVTGL
jgi:TP901-1 family phage major tail protein